MKKVYCYTDGACRGNPGPGGYGAILVYAGAEKEFSGGEPVTTNNRMELTAAIVALEALNEPCEVTLTSDSKYLTDAVTKGWLDGWKKRGWKNAAGQAVENQDLWFILLAQTKKHHVTFYKVKGHADHPENIRCDELATGAIKEYRRINAMDEESKA